MVHGIALSAALAVVGLTAHSMRWSLLPLSVITVFTVVSDITAVDSGSKLKVSGTSLGLMLAIVLLGGGPAAMIALLTLLVSWASFDVRKSTWLVRSLADADPYLGHGISAASEIMLELVGRSLGLAEPPRS